MKRILVLICVVLLLAGCGSGEEPIDRAQALRQRLLSANGCSFTAVVTADFGDMTYAFTLDCAADSNGAMTFRVIAPETIEGISGRVSATGGKLTFDDTILSFPLLAEGELSPVSAPWLVYTALAGGYIRSCGEDGDGLRLTVDDTFREENLQLDLWTDSEGLPKYAELLWQGRKLISMRIEDFRFL